MTIEMPEAIDLSQYGEEVEELPLRAPSTAVREAEQYVARLWRELSPEDRAAADPVRDALRTLYIVYVSQRDDRLYRLFSDSVKRLLETHVSSSDLSSLPFDAVLMDAHGEVLAAVEIKWTAHPAALRAEAEADTAKEAGLVSRPHSGEEFLEALAGDAGLTLDDVLNEAGLERGDI